MPTCTVCGQPARVGQYGTVHADRRQIDRLIVAGRYPYPDHNAVVPVPTPDCDSGQGQWNTVPGGTFS